MDPDANIRAQISVLRRLRTLQAADYRDRAAIRAARAEYAELYDAYSTWRRNGGFAATDMLLAKRDSYLSVAA